MNYFGLFFSFMLPGIILGVVAALAVRQEFVSRERKAKQRRAPAKPVACLPAEKRTKLYIYDMNAA